MNQEGKKRHGNDDPVHRRKQSWLFNTAGCFWTWHSWDGCEGINDTTYYFDGWQYLKPLRSYFESIPFWRMDPSYTVCSVRDSGLISSTLSAPDRQITIMYCCTHESGRTVTGTKAFIRIKDGIYNIRFIDPSDLRLISEINFESKGLRSESTIGLPDFGDDILVEITEKSARVKSLIDGTL